MEIGMKRMLWITVAVTIAVAAFISSDEFDRAGIMSSEGYIERGSKFGMDIGMPRDVATTKLAARGLEPVELTATQSCHNRTFRPERQVELWCDRTWRRGTICISSEQNKVASVSWIYNRAAP